MSSKLEREIRVKLEHTEAMTLAGDARDYVAYAVLVARRIAFKELLDFIEDERKNADASNPGEVQDDD